MRDNPQAMMNVPYDRLVAHAYGQYTPPQRTWVGLTDEEIEQMGLSNYIKVVRETEAKLKEKNNG